MKRVVEFPLDVGDWVEVKFLGKGDEVIKVDAKVLKLHYSNSGISFDTTCGVYYEGDIGKCVFIKKEG